MPMPAPTLHAISDRRHLLLRVSALWAAVSLPGCGGGAAGGGEPVATPTPAPSSAPAPAPVTAPAPGADGPVQITAAGVSVATLQAACDIGGAITLSAGLLSGDAACAVVEKAATLSGQARLVAAGIQGKGILITRADTVIVDLDLSGATVADQNGAAIRHEGGNLVLSRVKLHDCENGILGNNSGIGTVELDGCQVYSNGFGTGFTHGIYIGVIEKLTVRNSSFWNTRIGHHVKSRAKVSVIADSSIGTDFDGTESYNLDFQVAGDVTVSNCVMREGPKTDNPAMLNYGDDIAGSHAVSALKVYGCTFESTNTARAAIGIRNWSPTVVADVQDCKFIGVPTPVSGRFTMRRCTLNGVALPDVG